MTLSSPLQSLPCNPSLLLKAMLEEQATRRSQRKLTDYRPYAKQREFHAAGSRFQQRLLMAANQCITPWMALQTDRGERRSGELIGEGSINVMSWDGSSRCSKRASHVFPKSIEQAFQIHLDNGKVFQCSGMHRVFANENLAVRRPSGWVSIDRLIRELSARHWMRTPQGWSASCAWDAHPSDEQLLPEEGIGDSRIATRCDAPSIDLLSWHLDASASIELHSRAFRVSARLSIHDEMSLASDLCEHFEAPGVTRFSLPSFSKAQIACLSGNELTLAQAEWEAEVLRQLSKFPLVSSVLLAFDSPPVFDGNRILAVIPLGLQPIFDIEVDETACYVAEGLVHHNSGKTLAAAMETAMHTTGRYPDWWQGFRFSRSTRGICGSESAELTKKGVLRLLLGNPENESEWGTGAIPKECILDVNRARGVPDAVGSIVVRSDLGGGASIINMASYDQGRTKWQADTLDWAWCDEEPPEAVYSEVLTRLNVSGGPLYCTFTPLLGMSKVVLRFYPPATAMPNTHCTQMTIDDVDHYDAAAKKRITEQYEEWERDARIRGIPILGSGRVFPVSEEIIRVAPFDLPKHWACIGGLDFGWDHPSAAVKEAWDKDTDTLYIVAAHRQRQQTPSMFAETIKPWGAMTARPGHTQQWMPWAWPHDGLQHDKGSGEQLAKQYANQGLLMLPERATFEDGTNGLEAGVTEMLDRMRSGRLKVFSNLNDWFEEFRTYHRKDGLIVKIADDLMSASRYAEMMRRFAKVKKDPKNREDRQPISWMTA